MMVGVNEIVGVKLGVIVGRGDGVKVGGRGVPLGVMVRVEVMVKVEVGVREGDFVKVGVGGIPLTIKRLETFHSFPMNICTSYSPGCH